jgi:hypothetical protein
LRHGTWQGKQIVPKGGVEQSTNADGMTRYSGYKNQWWSRTNGVSFTDTGKAQDFAKTKEVHPSKRFFRKELHHNNL